MRKVTIPIVILLTAIVTAALTSAFWLIAFNAGRSDAPEREKVITETAEPGTAPDLVLGPSGLAIPVQGVSARDLVDTYAQARGGGMRVITASRMSSTPSPVLALVSSTSSGSQPTRPASSPVCRRRSSPPSNGPVFLTRMLTSPLSPEEPAPEKRL